MYLSFFSMFSKGAFTLCRGWLLAKPTAGLPYTPELAFSRTISVEDDLLVASHNMELLTGTPGS